MKVSLLEKKDTFSIISVENLFVSVIKYFSHVAKTGEFFLVYTKTKQTYQGQW